MLSYSISKNAENRLFATLEVDGDGGEDGGAAPQAVHGRKEVAFAYDNKIVWGGHNMMLFESVLYV